MSFLFICFLWFIYHGSGHNIPIETNRWLFGLTIVNIIIIGILIIALKRISKRE
jgi:hypothetical protein